MKYAQRIRFFIHIITTWIVLTLCFVQSEAQMPDYQLQQFDYSSGIRPGNIVALSKDKKGFLWILYRRSVQRFDGSRIIEFKPGNDLNQIICDSSGRLWISSYKKIYLFDECKQEFEEVAVQLRDSSYTYGNILLLPGRRVLLSSNHTLYEYDTKRQQFFASATQAPLKGSFDIRTFCNYGHSIFFNKGRTVYRYQTQLKKLDSVTGMFPRAIFPLSEDSAILSNWSPECYWVNFLTGRASVVDVPQNREPTGYGIKYFSIRDVQQVSAENFILTTSHGIFQYNVQSHYFQPLKIFEKGVQKLTADYTNYLYSDPDNYLWMTNADGIARFPLNGQSFGLVRMGKQVNNLPPSIDNIRAIAGDGKDNFWLATANGFINWNRKQNKWSIYLPVEGSANQLAHPSLRGIAWDGRYAILGPTDLGLWLFDPVTQKYRRPLYDSDSTRNRSEHDFVDAITTLQNGNQVITGRDAIYILEAGSYKLRLLNTVAAKENSNFCFQSPNGLVWLTTSVGLHLFDADMRYIQKVDLPFKRTLVRAGFAMSNNRFLFSLDDGVYIAAFENGKASAKKFTTVFDDIYVSALYQDENGFIWASSDNGIYRYDSLKRRLHLYDYTDNIQGYGFNLNSIYKSVDGTLFLGGINGLNYLKPEQMAAQPDSLRVYISYMKLFNDSVIYDVNAEWKIPYSQRSFEIGFTAPYYNNAAKVKYRYRLKGFDKEWKMLGNNNQLRFTSLSPGKYELEIEASINNVDWVGLPHPLSFSIAAPFWLTWWFILLCFLTMAVIIWVVLRNRNRRLKIKQEGLEAEQAINYFSSSMYDQHSVHQLLWDVAKNCIGRLHFEDCVIYLHDREKKVLYQKAAYGKKSTKDFTINNPIEIPLGVGITGYAALYAKPVIVKNTAIDERYIVDGKRRLSEIAVPIIADGTVYGVIDCEHSKKGFFTQKHLNILQTIASLCAGKIVKIKAEVEKNRAEKNLMETKQKMADVEMQALRAQMNPHFIFNCLNSINRYIVKSDQATASLYLTRFAKLIRLILDNSNSSTVTLTNELEALKLYIEMEAIRFETKFTYSIKTDKNVQPDAIFVPPLIIQPYVENSIWHGLLHKEEAGHLDIHVSLTNHILTCTIEDNGVGREKAKELKSKSASTKKSLGMKLTEDRLALLNKQTQLESTVVITDLYHTNGSPAGTRVIIQIPIDY